MNARDRRRRLGARPLAPLFVVVLTITAAPIAAALDLQSPAASVAGADDAGPHDAAPEVDAPASIERPARPVRTVRCARSAICVDEDEWRAWGEGVCALYPRVRVVPLRAPPGLRAANVPPSAYTQSRMRICYFDWGRRILPSQQAPPPGRLTIDLRLLGDGATPEVSVEPDASTLPEAKFVDCVIAAIRAESFDAGAPAYSRYALDFEPGYTLRSRYQPCGAGGAPR